MSRKPALNPYLPLSTYIPDGEPHVFGDRVYVYGSRDQEGGDNFCLMDYEVWSAPVDDLAVWRFEGVSYRAKQDPSWSPQRDNVMFAPDCVRGHDGRYYLYYAMSGGHFTSPIHVAVSDSPAGPFRYYGCVRREDGTPLTDYVTFDPSVINDEGTIRLYYGFSLDAMGRDADHFPREELKRQVMQVFDKTEEEMARSPESIMGANTVALADDMLTCLHAPRRVIPGTYDALGTSFHGHAFFEACSIRRIGGTYYLVYSSEHQHELCYATSPHPDRDFVYGGVIISNGDIGYHGRAKDERLATTGNNHGGLVEIRGQWYIFYHRQTHRNTYSRQGCAEKVSFTPDGRIPQVEMTSCGLNDGPLPARGVYPAACACNLTHGRMGHASNIPPAFPTPCVTHQGDERFITEICDNTLIVWKYFDFTQPCTLTLTLRGNARGTLSVLCGDDPQGDLPIAPASNWTNISLPLHALGPLPLCLRYHGTGLLDLLEIQLG